jgi:hypothetical protein
VKKDPDDDNVIAAAIMGKAAVICTRDKDFDEPPIHAYCQQNGIRIMTEGRQLQSRWKIGSLQAVGSGPRELLLQFSSRRLS